MIDTKPIIAFLIARENDQKNIQNSKVQRRANAEKIKAIKRETRDINGRIVFCQTAHDCNLTVKSSLLCLLFKNTFKEQIFNIYHALLFFNALQSIKCLI